MLVLVLVLVLVRVLALAVVVVVVVVLVRAPELAVHPREEPVGALVRCRVGDAASWEALRGSTIVEGLVGFGSVIDCNPHCTCTHLCCVLLPRWLKCPLQLPSFTLPPASSLRA